MNIVAKCLVFALLCSVLSCTDDFSRFQFGQKKPTKARDAGAQNMSDATGTERDGAVGDTTAQSE